MDDFSRISMAVLYLMILVNSSFCASVSFSSFAKCAIILVTDLSKNFSLMLPSSASRYSSKILNWTKLIAVGNFLTVQHIFLFKDHNQSSNRIVMGCWFRKGIHDITDGCRFHLPVDFLDLVFSFGQFFHDQVIDDSNLLTF